MPTANGLRLRKWKALHLGKLWKPFVQCLSVLASHSSLSVIIGLSWSQRSLRFSWRPMEFNIFNQHLIIRPQTVLLRGLSRQWSKLLSGHRVNYHSINTSALLYSLIETLTMPPPKCLLPPPCSKDSSALVWICWNLRKQNRLFKHNKTSRWIDV